MPILFYRFNRTKFHFSFLRCLPFGLVFIPFLCVHFKNRVKLHLCYFTQYSKRKTNQFTESWNMSCLKFSIKKVRQNRMWRQAEIVLMAWVEALNTIWWHNNVKNTHTHSPSYAHMHFYNARDAHSSEKTKGLSFQALCGHINHFKANIFLHDGKIKSLVWVPSSCFDMRSCICSVTCRQYRIFWIKLSPVWRVCDAHSTALCFSMSIHWFLSRILQNAIDLKPHRALFYAFIAIYWNEMCATAFLNSSGDFIYS